MRLMHMMFGAICLTRHDRVQNAGQDWSSRPATEDICQPIWYPICWRRPAAETAV